MYSINSGLSERDFDHESPAEHEAAETVDATTAAAVKTKKGGKRVKHKAVKVGAAQRVPPA